MILEAFLKLNNLKIDAVYLFLPYLVKKLPLWNTPQNSGSKLAPIINNSIYIIK